MQTVTNNHTNAIVYTGPNNYFSFVPYLICKDFMDSNCTNENYTINNDAVIPPTEQDYINAVQNILDSTAQSKGYENILSACSYASISNTFQAEGILFLQWRSACWTYCYTQLALQNSGTIQAPTILELISALPIFTDTTTTP
jgi:hypothetical protein